MLYICNAHSLCSAFTMSLCLGKTSQKSIAAILSVQALGIHHQNKLSLQGQRADQMTSCDAILDLLQPKGKAQPKVKAQSKVYTLPKVNAHLHTQTRLPWADKAFADGPLADTPLQLRDGPPQKPWPWANGPFADGPLADGPLRMGHRQMVADMPAGVCLH